MPNIWMKKEKVITDRDILLHDGFGENISILSFTPLTQRLGIYVATPCFLLTLQLESSKMFAEYCSRV